MTKVTASIKADNRELTGRKVKQLRNKGLTPATIYGHNFTPISISVSTMELNKLFSCWESSLM